MTKCVHCPSLVWQKPKRKEMKREVEDNFIGSTICTVIDRKRLINYLHPLKQVTIQHCGSPNFINTKDSEALNQY